MKPAKSAPKPQDILPANRQRIQNLPDSTDPNAHVPLGPAHFGPEAGPPFSGFPRTTRARKRNSF